MGSWILESRWERNYDLKWVDDMAKLLGQVDGLLPKGLELKAVQTDLAWDGNKYGVVLNGADPKIDGCR